MLCSVWLFSIATENLSLIKTQFHIIRVTFILFSVLSLYGHIAIVFSVSDGIFNKSKKRGCRDGPLGTANVHSVGYSFGYSTFPLTVFGFLAQSSTASQCCQHGSQSCVKIAQAAALVGACAKVYCR